MSLIKFIVIKANKEFELDQNLKAFFQLSVFLFIPLFIILVAVKYKYKQLRYGDLKVKNVSSFLSFVSIFIYSIIMFLLFAYLLIV